MPAPCHSGFSTAKYNRKSMENIMITVLAIRYTFSLSSRHPKGNKPCLAREIDMFGQYDEEIIHIIRFSVTHLGLTIQQMRLDQGWRGEN
jgi:hypothetical protein